MPAIEPDHSRYPDVTAAGDLRTALQSAFDVLRLPLRAEHVSSPGWARTHALASTGDRHANVHMVSGERSFHVDFWTSGIQMAGGAAPDLARVAGAIGTFLDGADLRRLEEAWPFVSSGEFARAVERGEPEAIAFVWRRLLGPSPFRDRRGELHDFLAAAADEPRLRALYPFTSHLDLGLRRRVRPGADPALAWVRSFGDGRYLIAGPDRRQLYTPGPDPRTMRGETPVPGALGPATARESVALVLAAIDRSGPDTVRGDARMPAGSADNDRGRPAAQ